MAAVHLQAPKSAEFCISGPVFSEPIESNDLVKGRVNVRIRCTLGDAKLFRAALEPQNGGFGNGALWRGSLGSVISGSVMSQSVARSRSCVGPLPALSSRPCKTRRMTAFRRSLPVSPCSKLPVSQGLILAFRMAGLSPAQCG